jgi:16S rRNA processing protein RimM
VKHKKPNSGSNESQSTTVKPNTALPKALLSGEWIEVGRIVGVQGLKGEVRVYPDSDFPERFEQPGQRWLLHPNAVNPQPIELLSGRYLDGKGIYILRFAKIDDRAQAETLRDCRLLVPASDRPALEEDEFHVADLVGLAVFDQASQTQIGVVTDILPAGNDLLEVQLAQQPDADRPLKVLIPFVRAIVPVVDLQQKRIEITPPPGLLDP